MNITQMQIFMNEAHSFIETLNETLMKYLLERDELSSKRDALLITIEKQSAQQRRIEREKL